jgi:hypothetical protein
MMMMMMMMTMILKTLKIVIVGILYTALSLPYLR